MHPRIRHGFSLLLLAIFAASTLLPGLMLLDSERLEVSMTENRKLAGVPAWPADRDALQRFPEQFEAFVTDHFGFRSNLVRTYNLLHVNAGVSPLKRVLVGKQGWLYLEQSRLADSNRGALPLSEQKLSDLVESFELRHRYLSDQGRTMVVMAAPDKNTLYPEYLPGSLKIVGPSRYRQFHEAALASEFSYVDTLKVLEEAKAAGEPIYLKTDSHWSCRGAYLAYRALMETVRAAGYTRGRVLQESDIDFVPPAAHGGTDIVRNLLNLGGLIEEPFILSCRVKDREAITAIRPSDNKSFDYVYAAPPGREHRLYRKEHPVDGSRVLVYRDSYANAMVPFLIHSFDEVIYAAPGKTMGFEPDDIDRYDPDLVIYEFVERGLVYPPDNSRLQERLAP